MSDTDAPYIKQVFPISNSDGSYTMTFDAHVLNELRKGLRSLETNRNNQRKYKGSGPRRSITVQLIC
jgi:hypothetical protein